jgi:hypothetical protein
MWSTRCDELDAGRGSRFSVELDSGNATFAEVFRGWLEDGEFRAKFSDLLANSRYSAFRWETPPVTAATIGRHFEFVLLDSPALARDADPEAFAQHFGGSNDQGVVVFPTWAGMRSWSCRLPSRQSRVMRILRHSSAVRPSGSGTPYGVQSARPRWRALAASRYG